MIDLVSFLERVNIKGSSKGEIEIMPALDTYGTRKSPVLRGLNKAYSIIHLSIPHQVINIIKCKYKMSIL